MWGNTFSYFNIRVNDYASALAYHDSIAPVRGKVPEFRPVGNRTVRNAQVIKGRDGEIRFRLYRTDCVVYWPNGEIEFNLYPTPTTREFIGAVSRFYVKIYRDRMYLIHEGGYYTSECGALRVVDGSVVGADQETRKVLDKKRATEIRKLLKPWTTYARTMAALNGGRLDTSQCNWDVDHTIVQQLLDGDCPEENWSRLFVVPDCDMAVDAVTKLAYIVGGAVVEEPVPLGELPKYTAWQRK